MAIIKNKRVTIIAVVVLLLAVVSGIYFIKALNGRAISKANTSVSEILDVDKVVSHPESFKGTIGVVGKVIKVDESNASFALGCEDACIMMPVKYKGQMPKLGSKIIVYGEIKKAEEKYVFEAQKIEVK